jgi:hypothetical protein
MESRRFEMNRAMQLGLAALGLALTLLVARSFRTGEEPLAPDLARDAERLNATLPEMVSNGVRLDKAMAGPGNVFSYFYTVLYENTARELGDGAAGVSALRTQLKERVCLSMQEYRAHGVVVKYRLRAADGRTLANVSIDPRACD